MEPAKDENVVLLAIHLETGFMPRTAIAAMVSVMTVLQHELASHQEPRASCTTSCFTIANHQIHMAAPWVIFASMVI